MLYEKLLSFFESGWFAAQNDDETYLRLLYDGKKGGKWVCYAQAYEDQQLYIFFSVFPTPVEESKRLLMAELLTRINYGIKIGNFEMDMRDGEVRYKTSVIHENDDWVDEIIRPVTFFNLAMMDQYYSALDALLKGNCTPEEAFDLAVSE